MRTTRGLAIAGLLAAAVPAARADAIWCGTFGDERRPLAGATRSGPGVSGLPPGAAAPPALRVRVRVDDVRVDGVRDGRAASRLEAALGFEACLRPEEIGRGAAWGVELVVSTDGTVIDARVDGDPRGRACVADRARGLRLARAPAPRRVIARVSASPP